MIAFYTPELKGLKTRCFCIPNSMIDKAAAQALPPDTRVHIQCPQLYGIGLRFITGLANYAKRTNTDFAFSNSLVLCHKYRKIRALVRESLC